MAFADGLAVARGGFDVDKERARHHRDFVVAQPRHDGVEGAVLRVERVALPQQLTVIGIRLLALDCDPLALLGVARVLQPALDVEDAFLRCDRAAT